MKFLLTGLLLSVPTREAKLQIYSAPISEMETFQKQNSWKSTFLLALA